MEADGNGDTSKLQIVAMMNVPPLKVTEPRQVRKVLVSDEEHVSGIQGCYQIVMYYEMVREEDAHAHAHAHANGWCLAGWIVESLGMVLLDHPLLAGRLHTRDHSAFEIVTNFECGGYSIGISCSLLLAEVLLFENFLEKWVEIHTKMSQQRGKIETPIFYHPRLKNPESLPWDIISRTQSQNGVQSMVFKITGVVNLEKELWRELAMLCVEKAKQKQDTNLGSDFCLVVKESSELIKVESCSMNGVGKKMTHEFEISQSTWKEFGVYEVAFNVGNKPIHVSCWIGSVSDDGYAMAVPLPYLNQNSFAVVLVSPSLSS
ncbi:hypothetical protein Fmac_002195 [Flemingia macrophylla]|uniref:Uncharacterized protein n=1 Tax=Flemingia macrophylla TaxID=520843 RepID=A0ABD1NJ88_9FABA